VWLIRYPDHNHVGLTSFKIVRQSSSASLQCITSGFLATMAIASWQRNTFFWTASCCLNLKYRIILWRLELSFHNFGKFVWSREGNNYFKTKHYKLHISDNLGINCLITEFVDRGNYDIKRITHKGISAIELWNLHRWKQSLYFTIQVKVSYQIGKVFYQITKHLENHYTINATFIFK